MPVLPQRAALHVFAGAAEAGEGKGRIYRADAGVTVRGNTGNFLARIIHDRSSRNLTRHASLVKRISYLANKEMDSVLRSPRIVGEAGFTRYERSSMVSVDCHDDMPTAGFWGGASLRGSHLAGVRLFPRTSLRRVCLPQNINSDAGLRRCFPSLRKSIPLAGYHLW